MKIRNGFVSNSSSSSFIVYNKTSEVPTTYSIEDIEDLIIKSEYNTEYIGLPSRSGEHEFGWEFIEYSGLITKLNWCAIQIMYIENNRERYEKSYNFETAVKDILGVSVLYDYNAVNYNSITERWAYIDHQSAAYEDNTATDIFNSVDDIKRFLFDDTSYIQGGNDNADYEDYPEYIESLEEMGHRDEN